MILVTALDAGPESPVSKHPMAEKCQKIKYTPATEPDISGLHKKRGKASGIHQLKSKTFRLKRLAHLHYGLLERKPKALCLFPAISYQFIYRCIRRLEMLYRSTSTPRVIFFFSCVLFLISGVLAFRIYPTNSPRCFYKIGCTRQAPIFSA